jgi:hypothetical protein
MEQQDTGRFRKNTKDQYYTKPTTAKRCVDTILALLPETVSFQWVEPSAGAGVFLNNLPQSFEKIGVDLEPKSPNIQQGDFLEWVPPVSADGRIFFGNPPFGKQSSLAKSFIKRAAQYGNVIAFILPRSFVKPSMSNAFPLAFHCVHSEELEKNAFEVNGVEYNVPCVFQIWQKKSVNRILVAAVKEDGFEYVKPGQPFHIAFKRVGGLAGKCSTDTTSEYNPQYNHFLKLGDEYLPNIKKIVDVINAHIFPSNTVGPRSLSKSEINEVINRILRE